MSPLLYGRIIARMPVPLAVVDEGRARASDPMMEITNDLRSCMFLLADHIPRVLERPPLADASGCIEQMPCAPSGWYKAPECSAVPLLGLAFPARPPSGSRSRPRGRWLGRLQERNPPGSRR